MVALHSSKTSLVIGIGITLLSFSVRAQDTGFRNFIKKEGYVKFTDTARLPLPVKRNYRLIVNFFARNHFDKNNYYVESRSVKTENNFLSIYIRGTDGLKKLRKQEEENRQPPPGALGEHDGTLIVNIKSGSVDFRGDQ
jgi:hypothetical protein